MSAVADGANLSLRSPAVRVEVGGEDVSNIAIPLFAGVKVSGTVQIDGSPGPLPFDTSAVLPYFTGDLGHGEFFAARTSPDGNITGAIGFPGVFQVTVLGLPGGYYLKAATTGDTDILVSGLHIDSSTVSPVRLTVGRNTRTLSGTVLGPANGEAPGAAVVLVPAQEFRNRADRYRRVSADAQGRFHLSGIPLGNYSVFAFEGLTDDEFYSPEFISRYTGRGVEVAVSGDAESTASPHLIQVTP